MNILTIDYCSSNASEKVAESIHETGFAILENHPLCWKDIEKSYAEWNQFFNSDAKYNYPFNPDKQDGFIPLDHSHQAANSEYGIKDMKEVFQCYFPWGQYPSELSDLPRKLFDEKFKLATKILGWMEENLPDSIRAQLKNNLTDIVSRERTLYRAIHYPPLPQYIEPGAIRAAAHKDFSLLTLLPAATESGLQVKDNQGNWHEVSVNPQTIIINTGGTLQEASDFYYKSTVHQVINPDAKSAKRARLSLPLFIHGHRDVYLSQRYATVGHFFDEHIRALALNNHSVY
ncbi:MAG: 2OG-Fe(II) oxygenase family protein [Legionellaceae bacterium]|nr:2OG-Fe(II) oxygenase family protein [Legionellaceae bacterium]